MNAHATRRDQNVGDYPVSGDQNVWDYPVSGDQNVGDYRPRAGATR